MVFFIHTYVYLHTHKHKDKNKQTKPSWWQWHCPETSLGWQSSCRAQVPMAFLALVHKVGHAELWVHSSALRAVSACWLTDSCPFWIVQKGPFCNLTLRVSLSASK